MYRVTEAALVAEIAVWSNPFHINMLTALKGYQFYFYFTSITQETHGTYIHVLIGADDGFTL